MKVVNYILRFLFKSFKNDQILFYIIIYLQKPIVWPPKFLITLNDLFYFTANKKKLKSNN